MLAIGRCLMGAPELLMFDEPSLGLAPTVVQTVLKTIRDLNREGLTCVLVEQNVAVSLKLASRAYVLETVASRCRAAARPCWPTIVSAKLIWDYRSASGGLSAARL